MIVFLYAEDEDVSVLIQVKMFYGDMSNDVWTTRENK